MFTCSACGPHSSNPYPGAPNHPHCTTHPATLHHPTHPHFTTHPATLHHPTHPHCTTHPPTLLVTLTTQTHSPAPCSHALLVALAAQTHIPEAGWLVQWLSDCVSLIFRLRRHFAAPAFSAFVSTGWLAGPCSHALLVALTAQTHSPAPCSHALLVALTAQTYSPGPCSHVLLVALTTQTHIPVAGWLAQWLSDCVSLAFQLRRPCFLSFLAKALRA